MKLTVQIDLDGHSYKAEIDNFKLDFKNKEKRDNVLVNCGDILYDVCYPETRTNKLEEAKKMIEGLNAN